MQRAEQTAEIVAGAHRAERRLQVGQRVPSGGGSGGRGIFTIELGLQRRVGGQLGRATGSTNALATGIQALLCGLLGGVAGCGGIGDIL